MLAFCFRCVFKANFVVCYAADNACDSHRGATLFDMGDDDDDDEDLFAVMSKSSKTTTKSVSQVLTLSFPVCKFVSVKQVTESRPNVFATAFKSTSSY